MGNIDAERDWGHARDYVEGMWLMLQQDKADDYVLATNRKFSVRKFIEMAFAEVGITLEWQGTGEAEKGINKADGKALVEIDPRYFRPTEVELLIGDASKAKAELGWEPKTTVEELVREMVQADLTIFRKDKYLLDGGHSILNFHE
jgi:GDPmannose 4,6-dehydratase